MHFAFWPWKLTPEPNFTKIGDDLLPTQDYHPVKFHRPVSAHAGDIRYKTFAHKERHKETVNDISPSCLSARMDNNNNNNNNKNISQRWTTRLCDRVHYHLTFAGGNNLIYQ